MEFHHSERPDGSSQLGPDHHQAAHRWPRTRRTTGAFESGHFTTRLVRPGRPHPHPPQLPDGQLGSQCEFPHLRRSPKTPQIDKRLAQLLHNAAEFAEEQYSKFHKDQNLQTVVRSLTDQVARTVRIAQGKPGERRNRTVVAGGFNGMSPESSSLAPGGIPAPALSGLGGPASTAVTGSGDVAIGGVGAVAFHDIAWPPALADEIGWDWGDFSQLFESNFSDMAVGN